MTITDIRVKRISTPGKMRAVASITFDDMFVVHDIKIIEGQSGLFIAMPSKKMPNGEYKDVAHPLNSQAREKIQAEILTAYQNLPEEEGSFE